MFNECKELTSMPDISKWNTANLENNEDMFDGCDKLVNKPIINIKK